MELKEIVWEGVDRIRLGTSGGKEPSGVHTLQAIVSYILTPNV
jgi:hypothetical protein